MTRRSRSKTDATLLDNLMLRFDKIRPGSLRDEDRALLQVKIAHSLFRASLPSRRTGRAVPVAKELVSGAYGRMSNGWRSALIDLMAPPQ